MVNEQTIFAAFAATPWLLHVQSTDNMVNESYHVSGIFARWRTDHVTSMTDLVIGWLC